MNRIDVSRLRRCTGRWRRCSRGRCTRREYERSPTQDNRPQSCLQSHRWQHPKRLALVPRNEPLPNYAVAVVPGAGGRRRPPPTPGATRVTVHQPRAADGCPYSVALHPAAILAACWVVTSSPEESQARAAADDRHVQTGCTRLMTSDTFNPSTRARYRGCLTSGSTKYLSATTATHPTGKRSSPLV